MSDTYLTSFGIGISTLLILGTIIYFRSTSTKKKSKKNKKKPVKKLSITEQYQQSLLQVEQNVNNNIEPEIKSYYERFDKIPLDDRLYRFRFYQESLLKELIKLDGIDLTILEDEGLKKVLKDERKLIIKHIQGLQKGLDVYKKENISKYPVD